MGRSVIAAFLLCVVLVACATTGREQPLTIEKVGVDRRQYPGSALRGPEATANLPHPDEFRSVRVAFYAIDRIPADTLRPITDRLELILESGEGSLFLPAPRFTQGGRLDIGAEAVQALHDAIHDGSAGRFAKIDVISGVIAKGTTADFRVFDRELVERDHFAEPVRQSVFVDVTLADSGTRYLVAIGVKRVATPEPPLPTAGLGPEGPKLTLSETEAKTLDAVRREAVIVSIPVEGESGALAAVVPAPFLDTGGTAVAILVTISPPPAVDAPEHETHSKRITEFREEREKINAEREHEKLENPVEPQIWTGLKSAFAGLAQRDRRRSAFAYLGRTTGALLAEDIALAASTDPLDAVIDRAIEKIGAAPEHPDPDELGLALERASYEIALEFMRSHDAHAGLEGIILRHTGEVGRHPSLLSEFVEKARSLHDLRTRLVDENIIFLEDTSPASRVRAYDWLTQIDKAPQGYDPLANRRERRAAMSRFLETLEKGREGNR